MLSAWLAVVFGAIGGMFWYHEAVYSLPTPIPPRYEPVAIGSTPSLGDAWSHSGDKPIFIHFFNPDCPCSRFNIKHFKSLVTKYGDRVAFRVVVLNKEITYTADKIQKRYDLDVPISFDASVAERCGVYSTPQAVILGSGNKLYYRGNYNKARYCTDANSNYAQQALDSLLRHQPTPSLSPYAFKAYGCQLPNCTQ